MGCFLSIAVCGCVIFVKRAYDALIFCTDDTMWGLSRSLHAANIGKFTGKPLKNVTNVQFFFVALGWSADFKIEFVISHL